MDRNDDDLKDLAQRANALRTALARLRDELVTVNAAEQALVERLRTLGLDDSSSNTMVDGDEDSKTTVDRIEAGLSPSPRGLTRRSSLRPGEPLFSTLKAGAVGAGLALGVAVLVLLAVNLGSSRRIEAAAPVTVATSSAGFATPAVSIERDIPPPPPPAPSTPQVEATVSAAAPPPPAPVPSTVAKGPTGEPAAASAREATGPGTMTIVCTPKCEAISDNGVALSPTNLVNLSVPSGSHKLVLSGANGAKKTMFVNVTPGQNHQVRVTMDGARDYGF